MKYSFLVPVYNVEKYLGQCIESMLSQTYKNFEIILVDDGSTDSSGKICDDYAKQYPECIKVIHKQNEGHTATRQIAIKNAESDVCLFVDSDDYVESNLLETVNFEFQTDSQLDMVIYSFCYSNNGIKTHRKQKYFNEDKLFFGESKKEIYEALMFSAFINSLCVKATKTEILQNDPTDYSLIYDKWMAEDQYQSIYLVTEAKKIKYIDKALYNYRTDNASVTREFDVKTFHDRNMLYVYEKFLEMLPEWGMNDARTIAKLQAQWLNITIYYFWQFFETSQTLRNKRQIIFFDWGSFMPECNFAVNDFVVKNNLILFNEIEKRCFFSIYILSIKRKFRVLLKKLKRKIIR